MFLGCSTKTLLLPADDTMLAPSPTGKPRQPPGRGRGARAVGAASGKGWRQSTSALLRLSTDRERGFEGRAVAPSAARCLCHSAHHAFSLPWREAAAEIFRAQAPPFSKVPIFSLFIGELYKKTSFSFSHSRPPMSLPMFPVRNPLGAIVFRGRKAGVRPAPNQYWCGRCQSSQRSWGKGANCRQQNAAFEFGDLFEGKPQAGVQFVSAGCELARACTVFHGFWKHQLQFSIIAQRGRMEQPQSV